jgi:hypothetical protein
MKLIHHKLENGNDDPIELEFEGGNFSDPCWVYMNKAMNKGMGNASPFCHKTKVFLLSNGTPATVGQLRMTEVIVTDKPSVVLKHYENISRGDVFDCSVLHLQEFDNFQQAYEVAFYIREGHPLAYPPEK